MLFSQIFYCKYKVYLSVVYLSRWPYDRTTMSPRYLLKTTPSFHLTPFSIPCICSPCSSTVLLVSRRLHFSFHITHHSVTLIHLFKHFQFHSPFASYTQNHLDVLLIITSFTSTSISPSSIHLANNPLLPLSLTLVVSPCNVHVTLPYCIVWSICQCCLVIGWTVTIFVVSSPELQT